jgi:maltose/moltooligosaccharide transporter
MFGVGIAWASILSMPYAMLTGALPPSKMGTYMGIFNFFIVLPQILAATILGSITKHLFNNQPIYTLVFGECSLIVAGILTLIVNDADDPIHNRR